MKIVMTSVMDDGKKITLNPGDVLDPDDAKCPIDAEDVKRLLDVGGARLQTKEEAAAAAAAAAAHAEKERSNGPTIAEYVAAGYDPNGYPPTGYDSRSTKADIDAAIAAYAANGGKKK